MAEPSRHVYLLASPSKRLKVAPQLLGPGFNELLVISHSACIEGVVPVLPEVVVDLGVANVNNRVVVFMCPALVESTAIPDCVV